MKSLRGHLLIASPRLRGPFFEKTVILMIEHGPDGALGVVLNKPTEATIADAAEQILGEPLDWEKPIFLGGPVSGPLMVLHGEEDESDQPILPGLFRTIEAGKLQGLIRRRIEPSMVVANYSGWGPGQLEGEFDEDSWLTLPARLDHVFRDDEADDLWESVLRERGTSRLVDWLGLHRVPDDPTWN